MSWRQELKDMALEVTEIRTELTRIKRVEMSVNAKLDVLSRTIHEQLVRVVDRIIEMAMVNQGGRSDAVKHRHVARLDDQTPEKTDDPWAEEQDDWPPPGADVMNMP